jgi:DNA-binding NarL/FixJ family response regulator
MAYTSLMIIDAKSNLFTVRTALEQRYDVAVGHAKNLDAALEMARDFPPDFILLNPLSVGSQVKEFLTALSHVGKSTPVIVVGNDAVVQDLRPAYPYIVGYVPRTYSETDLLPFLQQQRRTPTGQLRSRALAERAALVEMNQLLERRVQEVLILQHIGRSVASLTRLDTILGRIVEAAVYLLRAEEASIMLRDAGTNELYLRAQKGLGEKQARGFNLKVEDSLIGSVVRTGQPVRMACDASGHTRLKVVTGYLVNALLYVPLTLRGQVMGVLGVANQRANNAFSSHDQRLLEALADYAALAIEVARQHAVIQQVAEELAVADTITAAVQELDQRLNPDDPEIISALRRIAGSAHILARRAQREATDDV